MNQHDTTVGPNFFPRQLNAMLAEPELCNSEEWMLAFAERLLKHMRAVPTSSDDPVCLIGASGIMRLLYLEACPAPVTRELVR